MCGIAGFFLRKGLSNSDSYRVIKNMSEQIAKRGPDDEGYIVFDGNEVKVLGGGSSQLHSGSDVEYLPKRLLTEDDTNNVRVAMVHRRLSILDLSELGHQPMSDESGRYWIVYNGEVYNFAQIREELRSLGYKFRTNTDTEVVLKSYIEWGWSALDRFNGMFAIAILDLVRRKLFLARDRVGIKPLFYYSTSEYFVFGSSVRSIFYSGLYHPEIDWEGMWYNFAFGFTIKPLTVYKGIRMLEAGMLMEVDLDSGEKRFHRYWQIPVGKDKKYSDEAEALNEFSLLINQAIEYRLISDVEVAVFLSGGVDSGILATIADSLHPGIKAFTLTYKDSHLFNNELERAILTAKTNKLNQILSYIDRQEVIDEIERIVEGYEEPFPQLGPTYFLAKRVKEAGIKTVQIGLGADEVFGGYGYYRNIRKWKLLRYLQFGLKYFAGKDKKGIKIRYSRAAKDWQEIYALMFMFYPDGLIKRLFTIDTQYDSMAALKQYLNPENLKFSSPVEVYNYYDLKLYVGSHNLYHGDQFFMDNSVEGRVPYLDHRIVEFGFEVSPKLKVCRTSRGIETKYLVKRLGLKYLPEEIVYARKLGFNLPLEMWLERELRDLKEEALLGLKRLEIFNNEQIERITRLGIGSYTWHLVMFYLWYKKFFG